MMRHTIKCTICKHRQVVNGQKQIDAFVSGHAHYQVDYFTGKYVDLDNPQDRIDLGIDKPALITGYQVGSVRDYWHKVSGGI